MPKLKDPLWKLLHQMSEDIAIGGEVNFKAMSMCCVLHQTNAKQEREMELLHRRGKKLIDDLIQFWENNPKLKR